MSKKEEVTQAPAEEVEESGVRLVFNKIDEYVTGISGSGKRTKNNGDLVAQAVDGFTVEELTVVATKLGIEIPDYSHLNVGMQGMNIRNKIRGAYNAAEKAEAGSGVALLEKGITKTMRNTADKRIAALAKEAEDRAAAKAAAKAEKPAKAAKKEKAA